MRRIIYFQILFSVFRTSNEGNESTTKLTSQSRRHCAGLCINTSLYPYPYQTVTIIFLLNQSQAGTRDNLADRTGQAVQMWVSKQKHTRIFLIIGCYMTEGRLWYPYCVYILCVIQMCWDYTNQRWKRQSTLMMSNLVHTVRICIWNRPWTSRHI